MHPLRRVIRRFDGWLSQVEGVAPFTDDPRVILRLQRGRSTYPLELPAGILPAGAPVLLIHLWNERLSAIPADGPDLVWALGFQRRLKYSLIKLAGHIRETPQLESAQAVGGVTAHLNFGGNTGGETLLRHLGFALFPYHRPAGAFGEFWENFYTYWLIWAYNPISLRQRNLWRLRRVEFWMPAQAFLEKYIQK